MNEALGTRTGHGTGGSGPPLRRRLKRLGGIRRMRGSLRRRLDPGWKADRKSGFEGFHGDVPG